MKPAKKKFTRKIMVPVLVNPLALIRHQPSDPNRVAKIKQQAMERRERRAQKRLGKAFALDLRKAEDGEL